MNEDEKFFAWLDGELSPAEAAEMEARVAADPQLSRLAEQHRALGNHLRGAFDQVAASPLPEKLQSAVRKPAEVVDLATVRAARRPRPLPQWAALAATLVIGVLVGTMVPRGGNAPVEVQGGKMYAASALNRALDTELASAPSGDVRIGLTFRNRGGAICRTFTSPASSGLACRDGSRWRLNGLFGAPEGQADAYRMAGGMDPNLAALVDSTIIGEPFDAATEASERKKGWH